MSRVGAIGAGANAALSYQLIRQAERTAMPSDSAAETAQKAEPASVGRERVEADRESAKSEKDGVRSLSSYTSDQVQRLFRQGQITRNEMDRELDRRDQLKESMDKSAGKVSDKEADEKKTEEKKTREKKDEMTEQAGIGHAAVAKKNADEVESEAIDSKSDAKAGAASDTSSEEKKAAMKAARMQESEFESRMGRLMEEKQDFSLTMGATTDAAEHDREKVMENILNSRIAPGNLGQQ